MGIKKETINIINDINNGKYSNIALNEYFKNHHTPKKERAFITEIVYGVIRNKIFLDYMMDKRVKNIKKEWIRNLLRLSIYQITFMDSDNKGVIWEATELAKKKFSIPVGRFVNGVLRDYQREYENEMNELKKDNRFDILLSYPKWFYDKITKEYGENSLKMLKNLKKVPHISFRVNKLKYSCEEFEKLLREQEIKIIKKVDSVYYLNTGILLYSDEFKDGKIIVQDASSYLSARNLNALPNETVIDCCGAPGGKSLVLSETMDNQGKILTIDIYPHKIKLIDENAKKMGATIINPILMDARKLKNQGQKFDKILVDAPCSGYGVLSKKPEVIYNKKQDNIENLASLQFEILDSASHILKVGGDMVYSTCTITKQENEENVKKFLLSHPNFKTQELYIPENVSGIYDEFGGFTIDFNEDILDNFYIVKFKKVSE